MWSWCLRRGEVARSFFAVITIVAVISCDIGRGIKAAKRVQDSVRQEFAVTANVSATTFKPKNGAQVVTVYVQLEQPPAGDPKAAKSRIEAIVRTEFPEVTKIVIAGLL